MHCMCYFVVVVVFFFKQPRFQNYPEYKYLKNRWFSNCAIPLAVTVFQLSRQAILLYIHDSNCTIPLAVTVFQLSRQAFLLYIHVLYNKGKQLMTLG